MKWLKELGRRRTYLGRREGQLEGARSAWQIRWFEDLAADLAYAFRAFRRSPGFALAAVFSLALGIGANTTIFSLTMEFLFSEPSCRRPQTLASIRIGGNSHSPFREYRFVRDARVFDGLAGMREDAEVNWRSGEDTYRLWGMRVTDNFFEVAGVPMAMGRPIQSGEQNAVVLSHDFWQRRLSGDAQVLGRTLVLDGQPYTVAGILPRDHRTLFGFGLAPHLYLPVSQQRDNVAFVARLPEGMSRQAAMDRLKVVCQELDKVYPRPGGDSWAHNVEVRAVTGMDRLRSVSGVPFVAFFGMLMVLVGLVLLIACANVASLLVARAASRRQEIAIRLAIGAGRGRIVRQLLTESLLLAGAGTVAGLGLNLWLTGWMNRVPLPVPIPIQLFIAPDWRLLLYSAALALLSAIISGLTPALQSTRADVNVALKQEERQVGGRRWNLRNLLVAGQLAVSVVLLAAGFLFLRNLMKATSMNLGFDTEHTLWAYMRLVPEKYPAPDKTRTLVTAALDELWGLPGIEAASIARMVPLNDNNVRMADLRTDVDDRAVRTTYTVNSVGPEYFKTMGISILQGREFLLSDRAGSPPVLILNENFARRAFGTTNPVGHTVWFGDGKPTLVVGVAKNSKYFTLGEENRLALYLPYLQGGSVVNLHFLVRTSQSPESAVREVSAALGKLDRTAAIETKPMRNALGLAVLPSQVGAALLGAMGILGLTLAAIGLYGVLAYAVTRRTREIGVRMALGAASGDILKMILLKGSLLAGIGMTAGLGLALFATRPLAMFLVPELSPTDPAAFLAVVVVLGAVAAVAMLGPALRALRVDPMIALRYE